MNAQPFGRSDLRRSAALWTHYLRNDAAGVRAVIEEATEVDQLEALAWSLPAVMCAQLEPSGLQVLGDRLSAVVAAYATGEALDPDQHHDQHHDQTHTDPTRYDQMHDHTEGNTDD